MASNKILTLKRPNYKTNKNDSLQRQREKLALPEYGRNIQRMIDHCLTIEDRDERTKCAHSIADVMATLFPSIIGEGGNRRKIWDHIFIMSDFKLDIDFPCEVVTPEKLVKRQKKFLTTVRYTDIGNMEKISNR